METPSERRGGHLAHRSYPAFFAAITLALGAPSASHAQSAFTFTDESSSPARTFEIHVPEKERELFSQRVHAFAETNGFQMEERVVNPIRPGIVIALDRHDVYWVIYNPFEAETFRSNIYLARKSKDSDRFLDDLQSRLSKALQGIPGVSVRADSADHR
jgi:hypothetical protein